MASDSRDLPQGGPPRPDGQAGSGRTATGGVAEVAARDPELAELERRHNRFIWPVTAFFLIYYLSLNVLAGVAPELMGRKLFGEFTFGYLYALSQFLMVFVVAWVYTRYARRRLDPLSADLRDRYTAVDSEEVTR
jgi:uncharacterized membrane protein (DUF485 family)